MNPFITMLPHALSVLGIVLNRKNGFLMSFNIPNPTANHVTFRWTLLSNKFIFNLIINFFEIYDIDDSIPSAQPDN